MKNQNLPPVGTPVFNLSRGWGKIIKIQEDANYVLVVEFNKAKDSYTKEGKYSIRNSYPTLSLTEYDLVKGGFTPISDWNKPKVGDVGYFWDDEDTFPESSADVRYGVLTDVLKDAKECYENNAFTFWGNFSPTIPEWYEKQLEQIKKGLQK